MEEKGRKYRSNEAFTQAAGHGGAVFFTSYSASFSFLGGAEALPVLLDMDFFYFFFLYGFLRFFLPSLLFGPVDRVKSLGMREASWG